jgi:predicted transcriptional regulator
MSKSAHLIVSIQPRHARNIVSGLKTVELRRRFPVNPVVGRFMLIYSTRPDQAIIGAAYIDDVCRMPVTSLWRRYRECICMTRLAFFEYFAGTTEGFGVILGSVFSFEEGIPASELRDRFSFHPPQSFRYVRGELAGILEDERVQIPNRHKYRDWPRGPSRGGSRAH